MLERASLNIIRQLIVGTICAFMVTCFLSHLAIGEDSIVGMLGGWASARTAIKDKINEEQQKQTTLQIEKTHLGDAQNMATTSLKHKQQELAAAQAQLAPVLAERDAHNAHPPDPYCAGCVAQYNAERDAGNAKMAPLVQRVEDLQAAITALEQSRASMNDKVIANAKELDEVETALAKLTPLLDWVSKQYEACLELASGGASPETIKHNCGNIQFDGEDVHLSNPELRPGGSCIFGSGPGCKSETVLPSDTSSAVGGHQSVSYTPAQQQLIDRDPEVQHYRAQQEAAEKDAATHQQRVTDLQEQIDNADSASEAVLSVDLANEKQAVSNAQGIAAAAKINAQERAKKVIMGTPILQPAESQP